MLTERYIKKLHQKNYPLALFLGDRKINFSVSLRISLIYLVLILIFTILFHIIIMLRGNSAMFKFWITLPMTIFFLLILVLNKRYFSTILNLGLGLTILIIASTHQFLANKYPRHFIEMCFFKDKANFMLFPLWLINLYLLVFSSIFIVYFIGDYYIVN